MTENGSLVIAGSEAVNGHQPALLSIDTAGSAEWHTALIGDAAVGIDLVERGHDDRLVVIASDTPGNRMYEVGPDGSFTIGACARSMPIPVSTTDAPIALAASFVSYGTTQASPIQHIVMLTPRVTTNALLCGSVCNVGITPFGSGLPGLAGFEPRLTGTSGVCEGTPSPTLRIVDGRGGASAVLGLSLASSSLPLLSGTLYPEPTLMAAIPITLGGAPNVPAQGTWDLTLNSGFENRIGVPITWQAFILDSFATMGLSMTNGLTLDPQLSQVQL